jgi:hypothetical protein
LLAATAVPLRTAWSEEYKSYPITGPYQQRPADPNPPSTFPTTATAGSDFAPEERYPAVNPNQVRYPERLPGLLDEPPPQERRGPLVPRAAEGPLPGVPAPAVPPRDRSQFFEPGRILALVGDQPILAGDLLGQVNQIIEANKDKIPEHQMDEIRETVIKQALKSAIETKLLYLDFLRTVPADKIPEIEKNVLEQYDKTQLEQTIASAGVGSAAELDAKLRSYGSSLSKMKRSFAERVMASEMLKRNVTKQPEVTHLEMLDYYREHADSFAIPAQTRWEQLMVRFDKSPSKAEAWIAIAQMGNAVLGGAPFAAVARRSSHGFMAQEGGQHDWTTKGSLKSTVLDEAIFSLPLDRLSQILEDEDGFHIIRVIERRETGRVPFTEAQVDIKEKLIESKKQDDGKAYLERLRKQTLVWTVFDDEDVQPQARAPQQSIGS